MPKVALFSGLVVDEFDQPVETTIVAGEPNYVVNDGGFRRHIPSEEVDRQVLAQMQAMVAGSENLIGEQAAKMLGQDDIFTRAMIIHQLKQMDKQFDALLQTGIPEDTRAYLGMTGFHIRINVHGEVLEIHQPGLSGTDEE